jgi:hypothetical protein
MNIKHLCIGCDMPREHCRCIQRGADRQPSPAQRAEAREQPSWRNISAQANVLAAMIDLRTWLASKDIAVLERAASRILTAIKQSAETRP